MEKQVQPSRKLGDKPIKLPLNIIKNQLNILLDLPETLDYQGFRGIMPI